MHSTIMTGGFLVGSSVQISGEKIKCIIKGYWYTKNILIFKIMIYDLYLCTNNIHTAAVHFNIIKRLS
jgi:hypothetical protein